MSDASPSLPRVLTTDGAQDPYDHEISLLDHTDADRTPPRSESPRGDRRGIVRNLNKASVREQLARRKYAKWQEEGDPKSSRVADDESNEASVATAPDAHDETEAQDFAIGDRPKKAKRQHEPPSEVDILYENQRGSFFCGIPLYSHSSLLNFDPSPWVSRNFKDSPVDITNAQLPDPSWQWSWKKWYVDMSADVDEEGWQYSFMFGNRFAWHGSHPWFHSFVRRRRWLRKRIRKVHAHGLVTKETMSAAHQLNAEYFTIHPKRDQSPDSYRPQSYLSARPADTINEAPEDLKDIASLLKALRLATIDREKIDAVKKFVESGGEELAYLGSQVPEIMSHLLFQNSKMQVLAFLKLTANEAQEHRDQHDAEEKPEGDAEKRRIDNLLAAIDAADKEISGLEYWSDRKHVLQTADGEDKQMRAISTIFDAPAPQPKPQEQPAAGIRGIADSAEVGLNPTHELVHQAYQKQSKDDKGKGKAEETERNRTFERAESPPGLRQDQVLIPDE